MITKNWSRAESPEIYLSSSSLFVPWRASRTNFMYIAFRAVSTHTEGRKTKPMLQPSTTYSKTKVITDYFLHSIETSLESERKEQQQSRMKANYFEQFSTEFLKVNPK